MAYSLAFKKSVNKDLRRLDKRIARRILDKLESSILPEPTRFPQLTGAYAGLRKARVGDYRVIFTVRRDEVLVLRIGHRRDVYRP